MTTTEKESAATLHPATSCGSAPARGHFPGSARMRGLFLSTLLAALLCTGGCAVLPAGESAPEVSSAPVEEAASTDESSAIAPENGDVQETPAEEPSAAKTPAEEEAKPLTATIRKLRTGAFVPFGDDRRVAVNEWENEKTGAVLYTVETDESKVIADMGYQEFVPFLVHVEGGDESAAGDCLYLDATGTLGQRMLFVYDLHQETLSEPLRYSGGLRREENRLPDVDDLILEDTCAFLPAYTIVTHCAITPQGIPEVLDPLPLFEDKTPLVALADIPADEVLYTTSGTYFKKRFIPEGHSLRLYTTDNANWIEMVDLDNDKHYRLEVDTEKYPLQINEQAVTSLFEGIQLDRKTD